MKQKKKNRTESFEHNISDKVLNGPSKICMSQILFFIKNFINGILSNICKGKYTTKEIKKIMKNIKLHECLECKKQ